MCVWLYVCVKGRKRENRLVRECVLFVSVRGRVGVNECECGAFVRACVRARRGRASRSNTWWRCRPAWGGWGTGCRHTCVSGATLARQLLRPSSRSAHIRRSRSCSRSYSCSCFYTARHEHATRLSLGASVCLSTARFSSGFRVRWIWCLRTGGVLRNSVSWGSRERPFGNPYGARTSPATAVKSGEREETKKKPAFCSCAIWGLRLLQLRGRRPEIRDISGLEDLIPGLSPA